MSDADPTLTCRLQWMRDGTTFFSDQLEQLDDASFHEPSLLPDWTRAHVVTHVARNADALGNLLHWARTGVEMPMYANREQRTREIEAGASRSAGTIRADFIAARRRLDDAIRALPQDAWEARVRTALGRQIPAREVPWMRTREVWVHAVDVGLNASYSSVPGEVIDALIADAVGIFNARDECPRLELAPDDRDTRWSLGGGKVDTILVRGRASDLLAWVIGRDGGEVLVVEPDGRLPALPAWL